MTMTIEIDAIANTHSHLREGDVMEMLVKLALEGGVDLIGPQPNTKKGLLIAQDVLGYEGRVRSFVPKGRTLHVVSFFQLTEHTTFEMIDECAKNGILHAKVYPLNRTTLSENGVRDYLKIIPLIQHCAKRGITVHFHPEHPWMLFDNRDAEREFLPIADMILRGTDATIFWEHGSDAQCIPFWKEMAESGRFFVTLTAHHLATYEDEAFGDVRSVCKPPIKTRRDRLDLCRLVGEDHPWVMAGADDAPHDKNEKNKDSGQCACGDYTAPFLALIYAHALDDLLTKTGGLEVFNNFTSRNFRRQNGSPEASHTLRLVRKPMRIPLLYEVGSWNVMPFWAGREIKWSFAT